MRSVSGAITTAEVGPILNPTHELTAQSELLSFNSGNLGASNSNVDTAIPSTIVQRSLGSDAAYGLFKHIAGYDIVYYGSLSDNNFTGISGFSIFGQNPVSPVTGVMRPGLFRESDNNVYYFSAYASGSLIQLQRANIGGSTSNPISPSFSNYGPTFGEQLAATYDAVTASTFVRRVERVMPVNGGCVVLVGSHSFLDRRSLISAYWVTPFAAKRLNILIQIPLEETFVHSYSFSKFLTNAAAVYDTDRVYVVVNTSEKGYPVEFTITNGVESNAEPAIHIDAEQVNAGFFPYNINMIAGMKYMTGRFVKTSSDNTSIGMDCYLIKSGDLGWSFGERSFFITSANVKGTILYNSSTQIVHYMGGNTKINAAATPMQGASAAVTDYTSRLIKWNLNQISDGADALDLVLANPDEAVSGLKGGTVLTLRSGQGANRSTIGKYSVDSAEDRVSTFGRADLSIRARDVAGKAVSDWKSPLDMWVEGSTIMSFDLDDEKDLIEKTDFKDWRKFSKDTGLTFTGLNSPMVFLYDAPGGDNITKVRVTFTVDDGYHLSYVGFILNGFEDEDGNFMATVLMVPKTRGESQGYTGTYSGLDRPRVRRFSLGKIDPEDQKKLGTGYSFEERNTISWLSVLAKEKITTPATGTYTYSPAYTVPINTQMELAVRTTGRRIQLYSRTRDESSAGWSNNSQFILRMEFELSELSAASSQGKIYSGLLVGTDVWSDRESFKEAEYNEIETGLTSAANYAQRANFTTYLGNLAPGSSDGIMNMGSPALSRPLNVQQYIFIDVGNSASRIVRVAEVITPGSVYRISDTSFTSATYSSVAVYSLGDADPWGEAGSGAVQRQEGTPPRNKTVVPNAKKRNKKLGGRAAFVSNDNTAISIRSVLSDGVLHILHSGSVGSADSTHIGWDWTNPVKDQTVEDINETSGSEPSAWRIIMHPNLLTEATAASVGLPTPGSGRVRYAILEEEIMRFVEISFFATNETRVRTWLCIPTFYAPLGPSAANSTIINQWWNGTVSVGDSFDTIPNIAGMLVEITSRENTAGAGEEETTYYYATGQGARNAPTVPYNYVALDKPYPHEIRNSGTGTEEDAFYVEGFGVISGRGQFKTQKKRHSSEKPVVYYPCDTNGNVASINVKWIDYCKGRYRTTEDVLSAISALCGVRSSSFRTAFTGDYSRAPYEISLSTSYVNLPMYEDVANFSLKLQAHIPSNSMSSGTPTNENALVIEFRNRYRLHLAQRTSNEEFQNGRFGNFFVGLELIGTEIAATSGIRWLERASVYVSRESLSGDVSGSGSTWTVDAAEDLLHRVRVSVQDNIIAVEINEQSVWWFNLDTMKVDGTISMKSETTGPIRIRSLSGVVTTVYATVQELGDRVDGFALRQSNSARSSIDEVTKDRGIKTRANTSGGMEFGLFLAREDAGLLRANLLSDVKSGADEELIGHMQVSGKDVTGDAIDETTLISTGYSFDSGNNEIVRTSKEAILQARIAIRQSRENLEKRNVTAYGRIAPQPEDKINLEYTPGGSLPAHVVSSHVITGINLSADSATIKGEFSLRKLVSL